MSGTVILPIAADKFRQRLVANLPDGWAGEDAVQFGLVADLLRAVGGGLSFAVGELQYTQLATRIFTATSPELDLASLDFFGGTLPRPAGMLDADFASLIISELFKSAATRPAIRDAIARLTGVVPRMLEPWNIFDTGVWDRTSYWDVDTRANPARWGDGSQNYQGFIETTAPSIPLIGPNNPILGWDTTAFWDVPGYFFADLQSNVGRNVYDLVNRLKAEGTTAWVKILSSVPAGSIVAPGPPTGLTLSVLTTTSLMAVWTAPPVGTRPITYTVQYRQTGTTAFQTGPTSQVTSAILSGLVSNTQYDVRVVAQNSGGSTPSAVVAGTTSVQPPSPATALTATLVQATAVTLTWNPPTSGTPPFSYTVQYNTTGVPPWSQFSVGVGATGVTVIGLQPSTLYFFEVVTSN